MSRVINGDVAFPSPDTEAPAKIRLDHLLMQQYPEYNRSSLQTFIKSGFVSFADGRRIAKKPNEKVPPDTELILSVPDTVQNHPTPAVIYEDDNVIVLNKPAGMLSMAKGEYCPEVTLENYGLLVHRLDRDTSGVVILAKNPATQTMLRKQFQDRKTRKTYYAIVSGEPKHQQALIDLPIARNIKHPTTFIVDPSGKPSQTNYQVLRTNHKFSLLELKPISGRTHQLRVHLQYLGTPIYGDPIYNDSTTEHRLFLHAHSLEITIPDPTDSSAPNLRKTFIAPLPEEFDHVF